MVQIASLISPESGVNDITLGWQVGSVLVDGVLRVLQLILGGFGHSEHVTPQMELSLPDVGDRLSQYFADVFDDYCVFRMVLATE